MFENEPDLLTRKDLERILHIGKSKVLFYIQEGYLPAFVLGNSYRVTKEDLEDFVKNCQENQTS